MALVVLAIVWAAVLIPPLVRQRAEVRPADSIGDFRRRLGVLQRTTPTTVQPAYRLQSAQPTQAPTPQAMQSRRMEAQRRRRDILLALGAGAVATLLIGLIPAFRSMLWLNLVFDLLLVGYIALLVQMKKRSEERRRKVAHLPTPVPAAPAQAANPQYSHMGEEGSVTVIAR